MANEWEPLSLSLLYYKVREVIMRLIHLKDKDWCDVEDESDEENKCKRKDEKQRQEWCKCKRRDEKKELSDASNSWTNGMNLINKER